jgi:hypothetical protein
MYTANIVDTVISSERCTPSQPTPYWFNKLLAGYDATEASDYATPDPERTAGSSGAIPDLSVTDIHSW